jgi:hypothetical protein
MEQLKDIWNNDKKPLDNEALKAYVQDDMSNAAQHEMESQFEEEDAFTQEAIDGLKETKPQNLDLTLFEINKKIDKKLAASKKNKRKVLNTTNTNTIAIIIILGLVIVGYIVVRLFLKKS